MKWIVAAAVALLVPASFAQTRMALATPKNSPVVLVQTTHGIPEALESAQWVNRSNRQITSYRMGWLTVISGKNTFHVGPWMNLPAGVKPGATATVPAQGIPLNRKASSMVFYVAGVRFSDGDQWKPTHTAVLRAAQAVSSTSHLTRPAYAITSPADRAKASFSMDLASASMTASAPSPGGSIRAPAVFVGRP